jgi:S1-C subfamily serine protease
MVLPSAPITPKLLEQETIALMWQSDEGLAVYCSGTWVSEKKILTAGHCVQFLAELADTESAVGLPALYATVDSPENGRAARVVAVDLAHDLALLEAMAPPSHPVPVLGPSPEDGDPIAICGHVLGYRWSYMTGVVSSTRVQEGPFDTAFKVIQVQSAIWKGDSGAAVFDRNGMIIGVVSYSARWSGVAFAVHGEHIADFLAKY